MKTAAFDILTICWIIYMSLECRLTHLHSSILCLCTPVKLESFSTKLKRWKGFSVRNVPSTLSNRLPPKVKPQLHTVFSIVFGPERVGSSSTFLITHADILTISSSTSHVFMSHGCFETKNRENVKLEVLTIQNSTDANWRATCGSVYLRNTTSTKPFGDTSMISAARMFMDGLWRTTTTWTLTISDPWLGRLWTVIRCVKYFPRIISYPNV